MIPRRGELVAAMLDKRKISLTLAIAIVINVLRTRSARRRN